MPASKRTTKKGKFIELARKRAFFQKKGEPKRNILHMPLTQKSMKAVNKELRQEKESFMKRAYEN